MASMEFSVKALSEALEAVKFPVRFTAGRTIAALAYGTLWRAI